MEQNGHETDLAELLKHSGWVQSLAYACVGDHALAEDVSQEVLIKALAQPQRSGATLRKWLAVVTRNVASNEIRRLVRRQAREEKAAHLASSMESQVQQQMIAAHLEVATAVGALSPPNRQLILWHFYQEQSFKQIAAQLGISTNNVHVRMHRALKELRILLRRQNGDWRSSCLLVLPSVFRKKPIASFLAPNVMALQSIGRMAVLVCSLIAVITCITWISFDWNREPILTEAAIAEHPILSTLEGESTEQDRMEFAATARKPITVAGEESNNTSLAMESCNGRVYRDGIPVHGAQIKIWQKGAFLTTQSDGDGLFAIDLIADEFASVTAMAAGRSEWVGWYPDDHGPLVLHLTKAPEEGDFAHVYDAITGAPLANANAQVFINWSGDNYLGSLCENALELIAEGTTNSNGAIRIPEKYHGMRFATSAQAEGYARNLAIDGSVKLYPGASLPVQLVDPRGAPMANLDVRLGYLVQQIDRTDEHGFLPTVTEWNATFDCADVLALPACVFLHLPDGRVWYRQSWFENVDDVRVLSDRIQYIVDTTPIQVELGNVNVPTGSWVEAKCMGTRFPALLPKDPDEIWQRLEFGEITELSHGWLVEDAVVVSRIMPGGAHLGKHKVVDGKAIVDGELVPLRVRLEGIPGIEIRDLVLMLANNKVENQQLSIPMIAGVAESTVPKFQFLAWIVDRGIGEEILVQGKRGRLERNFQLASHGGKIDHTVTAVELEMREVLIRVDGFPVIGGRVNFQSINFSGLTSVPFDSNGQPRIQNVFLQVPANLHHRAGGPILTSLRFSPASQLPGAMSTEQSGAVVWDLQLASVILIVPPLTGPSWSRNLSIEDPGVGLRLQWPPLNRDRWSKNFEISEGSNWIEFRLPAGPYRFKVGREVNYGGGEPILVQAAAVTSLQPD
ncbi:MAG: RNA polymerase sigma factor [Planctomycetes bacterium]|nr:RNA polymerase sigma factor [Planctomycetota bacterium]